MKNYFILNLQFFKNFYLMLGYSLTMINNVVIVSGGQQRDSAIYMCVCMCVCVSILPQTPLPPEGHTYFSPWAVTSIYNLLPKGYSRMVAFQPPSSLGFSGGASGKELTCQCRRCKRLRFDPWIGKILWRRAWQPTWVFLPGESHGQRSLEGSSPWGPKEMYRLSDLACMHIHHH